MKRMIKQFKIIFKVLNSKMNILKKQLLLLKLEIGMMGLELFQDNL